jgi:ABC-type Na+ efflux pump permease subunit
MNPRRLLAVCGLDVGHNARRSLFWIWAALLVFLAWGLSSGRARIQSGDSSVGGTKAHITSEFAVAQQFAILTPLAYGFFVAVVAGMAIIQDEECRVGELLHSTGLRPREYVWGKFLAVVLSAVGILAIHVGAMVLCNHVLPANGPAREVRGAFRFGNYLWPVLVFALPTVIFIAGIAFAVGARTRRPILVYFLPVAMFLLCVFFLWEWTPSWLDPSVDRLLMLIDPGGFRWLDERWLKVDRGVRFYNHGRIPLDGLIVANRILVMALGIAAVLYTQLRFTASLKGTSRAAERAWRRRNAEAQAPPDGDGLQPSPGPLAGLGMASRAPGLLSGALEVARVELIELRSSPGLYLFVPLLLLEAIGPNLIAVGAFDTPILLTSGTFAVRSLNPLTTLTCLLLMFYTVESLLRERNCRLAEIGRATPVRTGSVLIGKTMANSVIGVVIALAELAAGAGMLVYQGKVGLELRPFALVWGLLLIPTIVLWTAFVMAVLAITRNRYATYAAGLGVLIFTGYRQVVGRINWVGNWPLWSAVQWSDMSVLELDRWALVLSRTLAVGLAILFTVLTVRFYFRRDWDATRVMHRLRPGPLFVSTLRLLPFALLPLVAGAMLWGRVDRGFQGEATKELEKNYWRKNIATYRDWPLPDVASVDLDLDLDPAHGRFRSSGTYELVNHRDVALAKVPLTGAPHWEGVRWTLDGAPCEPEDRQRLYVFTPRTPLAPGDRLRIGFRFEGTFPRGISKRGGGTMEFILPSGVVLTSFSPSFVPVLGYMDQVGIDEENKYESREYPDDFYKGRTDSGFASGAPFRTRIKVTGPAEFTYNSVGTRTSDEVAAGRRTTVWESDHPVSFFNVVAGHWEARRGNGTAIYYHRGHPYNIAEMVDALDACRRHYSEWFRPFPWRELKLSEFPALASYAQGFPTDITFSESIGFLTQSEPGADAAFLVTAHEAAHQWWGNMITPGKGPGGDLLSEGTSHFSTLLLFERVKGPHGRIDFAKRIEDRYAKQRRADSERPLVKIDGSRDGDQTVTYDKAGFVFWMLLNHMGRDRALRGIREFFELYHANPDHPVLQDFLAVMREHAADKASFDAFTRQWFYQVVVPEYRLDGPRREREGDGWKVVARVTNVGTGTMPVEVAGVRGTRFKKDGTPGADYSDSRATITLGPGESREVIIRCGFEPERVIVDPDAKVLQLGRKQATRDL